MRALSKIVNTSNSLDDDLETIKLWVGLIAQTSLDRETNTVNVLVSLFLAIFREN